MFDFLGLGVIINDSIFCVHGGLSPSIHTIDQIKMIDRFKGKFILFCFTSKIFNPIINNFYYV